MKPEELKNILMTFVINGYHINTVDRISDGNSIANVYKFDKFGAKIHYSFLLSFQNLSEGLISTLRTCSANQGSNPVIICEYDDINSEIPCYSHNHFEKLIGGYVNTGLVLIPNLSRILNQLGLNKFVAGLEGDPDELLEIYVKECLQYLLLAPARRFGSDRIFESLPDGLVIGKNQLNILFDTKAYSKGFKIESDDMVRFEKYVIDYNQKYEHIFGRTFCFIIVSGKFIDSNEALKKRQITFYERTQTNLSILTSSNLGRLVEILNGHSQFRNSFNWKAIFSKLEVKPNDLKKQIIKLQKDYLL